MDVMIKGWGEGKERRDGSGTDNLTTVWRNGVSLMRGDCFVSVIQWRGDRKGGERRNKKDKCRVKKGRKRRECM